MTPPARMNNTVNPSQLKETMSILKSRFFNKLKDKKRHFEGLVSGRDLTEDEIALQSFDEQSCEQLSADQSVCD